MACVEPTRPEQVSSKKLDVYYGGVLWMNFIRSKKKY